MAVSNMSGDGDPDVLPSPDIVGLPGGCGEAQRPADRPGLEMGEEEGRGVTVAAQNGLEVVPFLDTHNVGEVEGPAEVNRGDGDGDKRYAYDIDGCTERRHQSGGTQARQLWQDQSCRRTPWWLRGPAQPAPCLAALLPP